ncbi:MAG TPA: prolyl oligopeptidase family serine peptidase [Vicinamibacterales bacterium]|nr:prolyl oligopeptidase family serine peptidase [Vicinamibacterales bacterium]
MQQAYGTWASPISAQVVAAQGLRLGAVSVDGDEIYWLEGRPSEGGRSVLVRRSRDGRHSDLTPPGFNVRTRVHEYGGGAYLVVNGEIYFSNFADQRIYRSGGSKKQDPPYETGAPYAITPAGDWFYADATFDARRRRLICVREDHSKGDHEPETTLVSIPVDGPESAGDVIASGYDFYSTPRLSPDGATLAWLSWRHPQMPWDGTELWVADVTPSGSLDGARCVAGGPTESVYQPGWSPDGTLYFVSDRDGWWKVYRVDGTRDSGLGIRDLSQVQAVIASPPPDAEFGRPQWVFGTATWAFAGLSRLVVSYTRAGRWHLATVDVESGVMSSLAQGLEPHDWLTTTPTHALVVAGSTISPDALVRIDLATGAVETLQTSSTLELDEGHISVPEPVEFATAEGLTAYAFFYPPRHGGCSGPAGERPPLIVISHGGPTTATNATLDLRVQYWTSRGFAVADVNYGGSSGYGRPYRQRLNGQWGIVDVADTVNVARHLVAQGKADPKRLIVRGGSAGGYTTLAALTFHPGEFEAGASYYGISDIEVLARDTHKFESRYLDTLVGPYPAARDVYRARSPIHFVDRLSCALILFQGLEDKVVPPNQSEMMANAVRAKGIPVAYLAFEGEQHGFRKASTIIRSLEGELFFYGAVFGFEPADPIEPVPIDNLQRRVSISSKCKVESAK